MALDVPVLHGGDLQQQADGNDIIRFSFVYHLVIHYCNKNKEYAAFGDSSRTVKIIR